MELCAKYIPISQRIRERNSNPFTALTDQQEQHIEIITNEMAAFRENLVRIWCNHGCKTKRRLTSYFR